MSRVEQPGSRLRVAHVLAALLTVVVVNCSTALAYTDPGTGSLVLQMLFAAGVGLLFYARRAFAWLRGSSKRRAADAPDSPDQTP